MMVIFIIVAVIEGLGFAGALYYLLSRQSGGNQSVILELDADLTERKPLSEEADEISARLVPIGTIKPIFSELSTLREALKVERGRVTITQAELETVESRLRELEEIERELEASSLETKEELRILNKKEKDLGQKNEALKTQLTEASKQIDQLIGEIEMSAEMRQEVDAIKINLTQTEQQVDLLLAQIEGGNEQYFILKQRYDALDIEYAQLYEKFSEAEAQMSS